jgi:hypothetical protein
MQRSSPTGNIPIELLRAVVATVDLGSFSKAAAGAPADTTRD